MKRRNLLRDSVGIFAGSMVLGSKAFAKPCPPTLHGGSALVTCGGSGSLVDAAAALSPGQSTHVTPNTLQHRQDIQWNVQTIFHDPVRDEIQYMGKPAFNQSQNHSHYTYDIAADQWSTSGQSMFPGFGHIWNATFDPTKGDYWFRPHNSTRMEWFDRSAGANGAWKSTPRQTSPALNGGGAHLGALGWHPNLFGAGNPGIFVWGLFRFFAYNMSTEAWHVLNPSNFSTSGPYWSRVNGQALYLPGSDQLICFADSKGNGHPAVVVDAGAGNSSDVLSDGLVSTGGTPPLEIFGGGGSSNHGHIVHHPNNANRLLLLEEHGSSRVWESANDGASWSQQSYTHPFQAMDNPSSGEYTVGTVAPYGVVIGMTSNSAGGEAVIWKPNN